MTRYENQNRKMLSKIESGLRKAAKKRERSDNHAFKKAQRAKYRVGAAKSPTPPPRKSFERDKKTLNILAIIESDCFAASGLLVKELAEKFHYELGMIEEDNLKFAVWTTDALILEHKRSRGKKRKALEMRIRDRLKPRKEQLRVYSWDKTTFHLKSIFYAWAMPAQSTRPFTLNMTKDVVDAAKVAKSSVPSHFNDRLRKLLNRRGLGSTEFWFVVEPGGEGTLHLHGAISWPEKSEEQARLNDALELLAGGKGQRRLKISIPGAPGGWAHYCQKHSILASRLVEGVPLCGSRSVQRRAKQLYDEFHAECRHLLQ